MLFLALTVTSCVSNFAFASLACVLVGITCSGVEIKIHTITAGVKIKVNYQEKVNNGLR